MKTPITERRKQVIREIGMRVGARGRVEDSDEYISVKKWSNVYYYLMRKTGKRGSYYVIDQNTGRIVGSAQKSEQDQMITQIRNKVAYIY